MKKKSMDQNLKQSKQQNLNLSRDKGKIWINDYKGMIVRVVNTELPTGIHLS